MSDLISRQEAIEAVCNNKEDTYYALEHLPSAEPDRKTGKWKFNPNGMDWGIAAWTCSKCGSKNDNIPAYVETRNGSVRLDNPFRFAGSSYCPCCGARMVDYE